MLTSLEPFFLVFLIICHCRCLLHLLFVAMPSSSLPCPHPSHHCPIVPGLATLRFVPIHVEGHSPPSLLKTLIGSPHCLTSEFAFYMHSEHYPYITTHFRILFHIFAAYFASSQLIRTSKAHFGNFRSILDLQSLFWKLCTSKTCIPTFGYLWTIHPDHTHLP
jgi:hypothetical protein